MAIPFDMAISNMWVSAQTFTSRTSRFRRRRLAFLPYRSKVLAGTPAGPPSAAPPAGRTPVQRNRKAEGPEGSGSGRVCEKSLYEDRADHATERYDGREELRRFSSTFSRSRSTPWSGTGHMPNPPDANSLTLSLARQVARTSSRTARSAASNVGTFESAIHPMTR